MTIGALAVAGWLISTVALIALLLARRLVAGRAREVAEACHELRGPLTAAVLGVGLVGRQGTPSPARVRAIELELERAALALDDLESARDGAGWHGRGGAGGRRRRARSERIGLARAAAEDAGKAGAVSVSIDELLADSVEAWRPAAALRGVELRLCWVGAPALVPGDRLRLAQATGNLIANAIEHGGGEVEVRGRAGPDRVRIEVCDRGPGLDAPVAQLVRRSRAADRHGHGLRIAHTIASAHGGRLAAAPTGGGARLVLELPVTAPGRSAQPDRS